MPHYSVCSYNNRCIRLESKFVCLKSQKGEESKAVVKIPQKYKLYNRSDVTISKNRYFSKKKTDCSFLNSASIIKLIYIEILLEQISQATGMAQMK